MFKLIVADLKMFGRTRMNGVGNRSSKLPQIVVLILFVLGVGSLFGCMPPDRSNLMQRDLNALKEAVTSQGQQNADIQRRLEQNERQLTEIRGGLARLTASPAQSSQSWRGLRKNWDFPAERLHHPLPVLLLLPLQ